MSNIITSPTPEFIRLPKPGTRDPHFGLSRSHFYELEKAGAFRLVRVKKRGALRGITLVPFDAVRDYLRGLAACASTASAR